MHFGNTGTPVIDNCYPMLTSSLPYRNAFSMAYTSLHKLAIPGCCPSAAYRAVSTSPLNTLLVIPRSSAFRSPQQDPLSMCLG